MKLNVYSVRFSALIERTTHRDQDGNEVKSRVPAGGTQTLSLAAPSQEDVTQYLEEEVLSEGERLHVEHIATVNSAVEVVGVISTRSFRKYMNAQESLAEAQAKRIAELEKEVEALTTPAQPPAPPAEPPLDQQLAQS